MCWQHALASGVYTIIKILKMAGTYEMDMDEYCTYFPEECEEMLRTQERYEEKY